MARQAARRTSSAHDEPSRSHQGESHEHAISIWEWVSAAIGALLVTSAIAYMAYFGISQSNEPPVVAVRPLDVTPVQSGYIVRFEARNTGGKTASTLVVGGDLKNGKATVEESETTLDYVPQNSTRRGWLFFSSDPSRHELELRVKGYTEP